MAVKKNTRKYSARRKSKKRRISHIGGKSNKSIEPAKDAKDVPEGTIALGKDGFYWKNVNGVWGKPASQYILIEEYNKQNGMTHESRKESKGNDHKTSSRKSTQKGSRKESRKESKKSTTYKEIKNRPKIMVPTSFVKEKEENTISQDGNVLDLVKELIKKTINRAPPVSEKNNASIPQHDIILLPHYTCTKKETPQRPKDTKVTKDTKGSQRDKQQKEFKYEFLDD
jgi:hypothetical protein